MNFHRSANVPVVRPVGWLQRPTGFRNEGERMTTEQLTAADIQRLLCRWLRNFHRTLVLPNVYVKGSPWEADLITVTKAYYWSEYEIKLTLSDYRADFQKKANRFNPASQRKHDTYVNGADSFLYRVLIPRPKHFWFVVPKGLLDGIDVPMHCGVIEVVDGSERCQRLKTIRPAPTLKNPTKLDQSAIYNLALKVATRFAWKDQ